MLEKLLNNDLESFYWAGYLLADGSFQNYIQVSSIREDHLKKLCKFFSVNYKKRIQTHGYNIGGVIYYANIYSKNGIINNVKKRFDINKNKTHNPPDMTTWNFTDDQLISLFIGFIDGDGCISKKSDKRKDFFIRIQVHNSWLNFLENYCIFFSKIINMNIPAPKINKRGYALFQNSNTTFIKYLKKFAIDNNLPIMICKWNKVDINYVSPKENVLINTDNIRIDLHNGLTIGQISKKYNISYQPIKKIKNNE